MGILDIVIELFLHQASSVFLAAMAFFLMSLYILQFFILPNGSEIIIGRSTRRNRLIMRALNWGIFGMVFLFFGEIIVFKNMIAWRATARVALMFLMLPEIAYQLTVLTPIIKGRVWMKH